MQVLNFSNQSCTSPNWYLPLLALPLRIFAQSIKVLYGFKGKIYNHFRNGVKNFVRSLVIIYCEKVSIWSGFWNWVCLLLALVMEGSNLVPLLRLAFLESNFGPFSFFSRNLSQIGSWKFGQKFFLRLKLYALEGSVIAWKIILF